MPSIRIQSKDLNYEEDAVITFDEGIVGLPHLRRLVIVNQPEIAPFMWLASVEEPETAFLVMDPYSHFGNYAPGIPVQAFARIGMKEKEQPLLLAIVRIMPEWDCSTVNLRAPIVIAPNSMRGTQLVLTESNYRLDEPLAALAAAA
jgi:flagellar assembly factor FliW